MRTMLVLPALSPLSSRCSFKINVESCSTPAPRIRTTLSLVTLKTSLVSSSFCPFPSFYARPNQSNPSVGLQRASMQKIYTYPDPIPEFAVVETGKFRSELLKRLSKYKDTFGGDINVVVDVCAEIFSNFLLKEYGGPGTLLVEPFTDMLLALKEKKLSGAPVAARTALLWAQNYVDQDWEAWTSQPPK
ncbi:protein PLASTID REDOX INSENSITIVE 2, chloroplastic [Aristolochia californica]|uniref:protein PLASTID REDOX INSENSITIVE 2, chloroplastic n=1 Tax=Aristolochia californica TaxID=171875 RepID=UPI0035E398C5